MANNVVATQATVQQDSLPPNHQPEGFGAALLLFIVLLLAFLLLACLALAGYAVHAGSWKSCTALTGAAMLIIHVLYRITMMLLGHQPEPLAARQIYLRGLFSKEKDKGMPIESGFREPETQKRRLRAGKLVNRDAE